MFTAIQPTANFFTHPLANILPWEIYCEHSCDRTKSHAKVGLENVSQRITSEMRRSQTRCWVADCLLWDEELTDEMLSCQLSRLKSHCTESNCCFFTNFVHLIATRRMWRNVGFLVLRYSVDPVSYSCYSTTGTFLNSQTHYSSTGRYCTVSIRSNNHSSCARIDNPVTGVGFSLIIIQKLLVYYAIYPFPQYTAHKPKDWTYIPTHQATSKEGNKHYKLKNWP